MRKLALALVVLAAVGATSNVAFAAATTTSSSSSSMMAPAKPAAAKPAPLTVTGKIAAVDAKACTVTLDNKTVYHFGAKCKIGSLKVGESVTITYKLSGKTDWVTKIVVAKA